MASSTRDVELVIRAKDEATKALATVTEALNTLTETQGKLANSANDTGSYLDKLGKSIEGMSAQSSGLKALGTAVAEMEKSGEAIGRLDEQFAKATARLDETRTKYAELGATMEAGRARSTELAAGIEREEAANKKLAVEINALDSVMGKLKSTMTGQRAELVKNTAATEEQKAAWRDNVNQMFAYGEKQNQLKAAAAALTDSIKTQRSEQVRLGAELSANSKTYDGLARRIESNSEMLAQASANVTQGKVAYGEMAQAASRAAEVLGVVSLTTEGVATASQRATETIRQLNAEMGKRNPSAAPAAASSGSPRQELMAAKDAVAQSEAVWKQASAAVAVLNAEIKATGAPTQEQAARFLLAKEAANQAKIAYEQSTVALANVRAGVREYVASATQQREATIAAAQATRDMASAEAALAGSDIYASQQQEMGILERLKVEWRELTAQLHQTIVAEREAATTTKETAASTNSAEESIGRLKAQVMGLAGAYLGLMGAMQAVKGVIDTYRTLEAARGQLLAVNNGDAKAASADMLFLQSTAERLGLSLMDVTEQYGKLAVATSTNNISQKTTRDLFTAVTEAARVVHLDNEKTANVLYGFVRMVDFGKVSARDFRSVLTQIPGAQKAMDDALDSNTGKLGITSEAFRKMQKSAEGIAVTDELLKGFADNLQARFADKLPFALKTFNTEWGKLQTGLQESQDTVGKSGFIEALTTQIQRLNAFMKSDEGVKYFQEIGHAMAALVNGIGYLMSHLGALKNIFELLIAMKIGSWIAALWPLAIKAAAGFEALLVAVEAFAAGTVGAAAIVDAALGGIPLLIGGIVFLLMKMVGDTAAGIGELDTALDAHERMIGRIQTAYMDAKGKVDDFRKSLKDLNEQQLKSGKVDVERGLKDTMAAMDAAASKVSSPKVIVGSEGVVATTGETASKAELTAAALTKLFAASKISAEAYRDALLKLHDTDETFAKSELYKTLSENITKVIAGRESIKDFDAALKMLKGSQADVDAGAKQLGLAFGDLKDAIPAEKLAAFNDGLDKLRRQIPELARAAEAAGKLKVARETLQTMLGGAGANVAMQKQAWDAYAQAAGAINAGEGFAAANNIDRSQMLTRAERAARLPDAQPANGRHTSYLEAESIIKSIGGIITSEHRSYEQQAEAYRKFLNGTGPKAAKPGSSDHELDPSRGGAIDVSMRNGMTLAKVVDAFTARGIALNQPQVETAPDGTRHIHAGWHNFAGGRSAARGPAPSFTSGGAFINALLEGLGIHHTDTTAAGFSKVGTSITDASKAEPGDIVILKGKGGVGVFKDRNEDGSIDIVGVQGRGKAKSRTVAQEEIAGYQRIPDAQQMNAEKAAAGAQAAEFHQMLRDVIVGAKKETAAIGMSPVDVAVTQTMQHFDKWLADGRVKAAQEGKPFTAGFGPGERAQVEKAIRDKFEAAHADEMRKKLAQLNVEWDKLLHGAQKVSVEERVRQEMILKGFGDKNGRPNDANSRAAQSTLMNIVGNQDMHEQAQGLIGQSSALTTAKGALRQAIRDGDAEEIKAQAAEIKRLNADILKGLPAVEAYFKAMGDQKVLAELAKVRKAIKDVHTGLLDGLELNREMAKGFSDTIGAFAKGLAGAITGANSLGDAFRGAGDAFLNFAANFLIKIADMILQAEILKLLNSALGFNPGGGIAGLVNGIVGVKHGGGIVGEAGGMSRSISPLAFAGAIRMHTGGIAGLKSDEYATILQRQEEVLTADSPRHIKNIANNVQAATQRPQDIKVINALDSGHMMSEALGTTQGQKAFVNFIRSNSRAVSAAMKG